MPPLGALWKSTVVDWQAPSATRSSAYEPQFPTRRHGCTKRLDRLERKLACQSRPLCIKCRVPPTKVRFPVLSRAALLATLSLATTTACGNDDADSRDAAPQGIVDAAENVSDAMNGVVCPGTQANYPGSLNGPTAGDDGVTLEFSGELDSSEDLLSISVASNAAANATIELPDAAWSVAICVNDADGSCSDRLEAYSGTMTVTSVAERFRASVDRLIFVDDLDAPTCSSSVSQASIDVSILGPT